MHRIFCISHRYVRVFLGLIAVILLTMCGSPETAPEQNKIAPTQADNPVQSLTDTPFPTLAGPPPNTPTPFPTIIIPMLTRTAFPVITMTTGSAGPVWSLPERVIPQPFGVEIHFTDATKWELDLMADAGIKWIRMDMDWAKVEPQQNHFDFSAYDRLVASMTRKTRKPALRSPSSPLVPRTAIGVKV
jgi:hypothetical protein